MEHNEQKIEPPVSGIIYGECAFWFTLAGVIIALVGVGWYLTGGKNTIDPDLFLARLWAGDTPQEIWEKSGTTILYGHWYLKHLNRSDALALLGISIVCLGAVAGMWGAFIGMLISKKEKERGMYTLYVTLVVIMAVLLTLSAAGIISIH